MKQFFKKNTITHLLLLSLGSTMHSLAMKASFFQKQNNLIKLMGAIFTDIDQAVLTKKVIRQQTILNVAIEKVLTEEGVFICRYA